MHMPEVTEQHRKLEAMVGEWEGVEEMHPNAWDAQGGKATSRSSGISGCQPSFSRALLESPNSVSTSVGRK